MTLSAGDGTVTSGNFASSLLSAFGLPTSQTWQTAINQWVNAEGGYNAATSGGAANNNPLNTNCDWPGQIGCATLSNGAKVGVYPNLATAVQSYATGGGINNFSYWKQASSPSQLLSLIQNSNWSSGHYGGNLSSTPVASTANASGTPTGTTTGIQIPTGNPLTDVLANWFASIFTGGKIGSPPPDLGSLVINGIAVLLGFLFIIIGIIRLTGSQDTIGKYLAAQGLIKGAGMFNQLGQAPENVSDALQNSYTSPHAQNTTPVAEVIAPEPGAGRGQDYSPETPRVRKPSQRITKPSKARTERVMALGNTDQAREVLNR